MNPLEAFQNINKVLMVTPSKNFVHVMMLFFVLHQDHQWPFKMKIKGELPKEINGYIESLLIYKGKFIKCQTFLWKNSPHSLGILQRMHGNVYLNWVVYVMFSMSLKIILNSHHLHKLYMWILMNDSFHYYLGSSPIEMWWKLYFLRNTSQGCTHMPLLVVLINIPTHPIQWRLKVMKKEFYRKNLIKDWKYFLNQIILLNLKMKIIMLKCNISIYHILNMRIFWEENMKIKLRSIYQVHRNLSSNMIRWKMLHWVWNGHILIMQIHKNIDNKKYWW